MYGVLGLVATTTSAERESDFAPAPDDHSERSAFLWIFGAAAPRGDHAILHVCHERNETISLKRERQLGEHLTLKRVGEWDVDGCRAAKEDERATGCQ